MNNEHIVLLTNGYPYGIGESFIEDEIEFLAKSFKRVTIISVTNDINEKRWVPNNCEVVRYQSKLSISRKAKIFFNLLFNLHSLINLIWLEKRIVNTKYHRKINRSMLTRMFSDCIKGFALYQFINTNYSANILYSYWLDQKALGLAWHKTLNGSSICVSRAHGGDLYFERTVDNYVPFQYFKVDQLDKIFFISENGFNYFQQITNCPTSKISISYLGINLPVTEAKYKLNSTKVIVSCSFILGIKRIELIIESIAKIKILPIKWIHIGDGPLKSELQKLAVQKLTGTGVEFAFLGNLAHSEVLNFYEQNQVDLFLNVSTSEGIPVSIMEAMSFGIPSIATNVGGTAELVNDSNGLLIGVNEVEDKLALQIVRLLTLDEDKMLELRDNAMQTINNKFNAQKNYHNFVMQLLYLQQ